MRGVMAGVGVVGPVLEAAAAAVEEIDDGESLAGREVGGEIDAVGHVAVEGLREEGHIAHGNAGELAGMVGEKRHECGAARGQA